MFFGKLVTYGQGKCTVSVKHILHWSNRAKTWADTLERFLGTCIGLN